MKNGICPKCGSAEVYRGLATEGEGLTAGSYASLVEISSDKERATLWIDTFICRVCGYLEMYVATPEHLCLLPRADGWERVDREGEKPL
jgi:predicted nucleic-acid-binding Zn-ribbon protein